MEPAAMAGPAPPPTRWDAMECDLLTARPAPDTLSTLARRGAPPAPSAGGGAVEGTLPAAPAFAAPPACAAAGPMYCCATASNAALSAAMALMAVASEAWMSVTRLRGAAAPGAAALPPPGPAARARPCCKGERKGGDKGEVKECEIEKHVCNCCESAGARAVCSARARPTVRRLASQRHAVTWSSSGSTGCAAVAAPRARTKHVLSAEFQVQSVRAVRHDAPSSCKVFWERHTAGG